MRTLHVVALSILMSASGAACGPKPPRPPATPTPSEAPSASGQGYDAELTAYSYPYEVHTRTFEAQQQTLRMAYMDVQPAQPNGRAVLLLHGKNFSGAYWARTIEALSARGYRVIVPDQIGFGKSSKPRHFQFSFQALATQTRDLLDALGVSKVAVVGHSMGGMLATRLALLHPEHVERLVLVNPIGLEDWSRVVPYTPIDQTYARERENTREKVREYMRQSYFDGTWRDEYEPLLALQGGWAEGPDRDLVAWVSALTYDMIMTQPVVHDFGRISAPTLLIIGTRDRTALGKNLVPKEVARTLGNYEVLGKQTAEAIPRAQLVELPGVGHVPQFESFEGYLAPLLTFLHGAGAAR